jgi:tetratricopeptide (TPR) repeat protein
MNVRDFIKELETTYRDRVLVLMVIRLAWLFLALALALIALDAAFAFSGVIRLTLDGLLALVLLGCMAWSLRQAFQSRERGRMLVRMVEEGNPDLQNVLTNAIDFEDRLDNEKGVPFSPALMRREIENATERATTPVNYDALTPPTLTRERWTLAGLALLFVASAAIFYLLFLAVVPRYLLPFADFPSYSPIRFAVNPGDTHVDFGDSLKIEVIASNRIPDALSLVLLDREGEEVSVVDMHDAGEGNFFQTLENLREPVSYFARTGRARTHRHAIAINTVPRIEDVVINYEYPAYTHKDPETRVLSEEPIRGYMDTKVTMRVRSNRPLQGGQVEVNGVAHPFTPTGEENIVEATFALAEAGNFSAGIVDIDGNAAKDSAQGTIEIISDNKPEIVIDQPGMDSFAVPDSKIPILVDASDDLGITKVAFFRRHNQSDDARKSIYEDDGATSFVTVDDTLDLKDLGVKPGDSIEYYATATDSRPGAPQTATSEMFRLQIISFEEYREFAQSQMTAEDLSQKYDEILEEMEAIAEVQKALKETTDALQEKMNQPVGLSEEEREQLAQAAGEQAELAKEAAEMAKRLEEMAEAPVVFDIENEYKESLRDFAERLTKANEHMKQAEEEMGKAGESGEEQKPGETPEGQEGQPPSGTPQESMQAASKAQQEALDQLAENAQQFKEGIQQANENLEHVAKVMGDTEQFKYLYGVQKSLERSISYYKQLTSLSPEDQVRLDELSVQQQEVQAALAELKEAIRLHADELDALAAKQKGTENETTPAAE